MNIQPGCSRRRLNDSLLLHLTLAAILFVLCSPRSVHGADEPFRSVEIVGVAVDPARTVCQKIISGPSSEQLCTPATFLNALRFGPEAFRKILDGLPGKTDQEKLTHIVETFGGASSTVEPGEKLFDVKRGVYSDDFAAYFNAILGAKSPDHLTGPYFDAMASEAPEKHLRRIHGMLAYSLERGVPVITSIRSFAAVQHGKEFLWNGIEGHTILIIGVPKELSTQAEGFTFQFIDPWTGLVREGYVYSETARGFQAVKGSGNTNYKWVDRSFLQIVAPSLVLDTHKQPWYARTFLMLNYGMGKFPQ